MVFLQHFRRGCPRLCWGFCSECSGVCLASRCLCFALFIEVAFRNLGVTGTRLSFGSSIFGNAPQTLVNGSAGHCLFRESSSRKHPGCLFRCAKSWGCGVWVYFVLVSVQRHLLLQGMYSWEDIYLVSNLHPACSFRIGWWKGFNTSHLDFGQIVIFGCFRCPKTISDVCCSVA